MIRALNQIRHPGCTEEIHHPGSIPGFASVVTLCTRIPGSRSTKDRSRRHLGKVTQIEIDPEHGSRSTKAWILTIQLNSPKCPMGLIAKAIFAPSNVILANIQDFADAREDIGDDLSDLSGQNIEQGRGER